MHSKAILFIKSQLPDVFDNRVAGHVTDAQAEDGKARQKGRGSKEQLRTEGEPVCKTLRHAKVWEAADQPQ